MKTRKSHKANLERLRSLFIQTGFIIALSFVLIAFEWTTTPADVSGIRLQDQGILFEPDMINTFQEKKEVRPPEPKQAEVLEVVRTDEPISHEFIPVSAEAGEKTVIPFHIPVAEKPEDTSDEPMVVAEIMPTFRNGGLKDFVAWIHSNVKYPPEALEHNIQGRVTARFVVGREGYVEDVQILRSDDHSFSREVTRVLMASPRWEPGLQNGKFVRVIFVVPVVFVQQ